MDTSGYWNDLDNVLFFTGGYVVEYDILLQDNETEEGIEKTTEQKPQVRDHEMTCYKVWINENNNFEFVFWWGYLDNNHVQIFDTAGNLVWEIDFEKENPTLQQSYPMACIL